MERERNISIFEERVLRCVHHEFAGMTQGEAAKFLGVSESKISRALDAMQKRSKVFRAIGIMFPILTKHQYRVYQLVVEEGKTFKETAKITGLSISAVKNVITAIKEKGQHIPGPLNPSRYKPGMDSEVARRY